MRAFALLFLAAASCSDAAGEWSVSNGTAIAETDVSAAPTLLTGSHAKELLSEAPAAQAYLIKFYGEREDRLGNDERILLYTATFPGDQIAVANFDNLDGFEVNLLATAAETGGADGAAIMIRTCPFRDAVCEEATGFAPL